MTAPHSPSTDNGTGDNDTAGTGRPGSARRLFLKRFALFSFSFGATALILELTVRLFFLPSPRLLRDQVYVSQIPMVTGRDTVHLVQGPALPEKKRDGETRIFVFGESSIEGAPWNYLGSPPTMLFDQLHARFPGRDLTVVNMGRSASMTRDAYYFLLSIGRFSPDFIVFYQGANDEFTGKSEMCMPVLHPGLHRAWRWLASHSRLAWMVRTEGPAFWVRLKRPRSPGASVPPPEVDECDRRQGFHAWTDLLVQTAQATGAQVIVTTPVRNPLRLPEGSVGWGLDRPLDTARWDASYRRVLSCVLTNGCDAAAAVEQHQSEARKQHPGSERQREDGIEARGAIWKDVAASRGARVVDFNSYLAGRRAGQPLRSLYAEEVHLTILGYWLLSWRWAEEIGAVLEGPAAAKREREEPPRLDQARYYTDISRDLRQVPACILLHCANVYLRTGMALMTASLLQSAVEAEVAVPGEMAISRAGLTSQLLLGWLRDKAGMDPALPARLAKLVPIKDVDPALIATALREHADCSTAGDVRLGALVEQGAVGGPDANGGNAPSAASQAQSAGANQGRHTADPHPNEDRGEPPADVIPPGQESVIMGLLDVQKVHPDACSLEEAQIRQTYVHAVYRCRDGQSGVIELHHPSHPVAVLARTDRFLLAAGQPAPSSALVEEVARNVKDKEAAFHWQKGGAAEKDKEKEQEKASVARRRRLPVAVSAGLLLLAVAVVGVGFSVVRRRRR